MKTAPDAVRIETLVANGRGSSTAELLGAVRQKSSILIADPTREIRSFRLALTANMATKRGRGRGSFIDSVLAATDTFYAEVLQYLKAWSAAPPKLRAAGPTPPDTEPTKPLSLSSTEYSSQDGTEQPPAPVDIDATEVNESVGAS